MTSPRSEFPTDDGLSLAYKFWPAPTATVLPPATASESATTAATAPRALVLLHRGHEHAHRWDSVVPALAASGATVFAWDARGHGRSPGRRGHAPGFMHYVRDLDAFFRHLAHAHGIRPENTVLVAHSVGAVGAATWAHDFAPRLAGLVLATPAFDVNLVVPGALSGIRLLQKLRPDATIKSYVRGDWLTRDPAAFREHAHYLNLPLLDLVEPTPATLDAAVAFIRHHHRERRVLIHCELGLRRSARVAERWLVAAGHHRDETEARAWLRTRALNNPRGAHV